MSLKKLEGNVFGYFFSSTLILKKTGKCIINFLNSVIHYFLIFSGFLLHKAHTHVSHLNDSSIFQFR